MAAAPVLDVMGDDSVPHFIDDLVEEPQRRPVPNHLLESKIYTQMGRNAALEAEPESLHFRGFGVGQSHRQLLRLVNVSREVISVHIIPPQSSRFTITYKKADRLAPGLAITLLVQFIPDEWRYHYDCIRVHCAGEETLLVPLHGYPVLCPPLLPSHVDLPAVSLGQRALHVFSLRCRCPVEFQFQIRSPQPHRDFHVCPESGVIPANGAVEVTVTYAPRSYGTSRLCLELLLSEVSAEVRRCVITGTCTPNLPARSEMCPEQPPSLVSRKKRHLQALQHHASQVIELQDMSSPCTTASTPNQHPGQRRPQSNDVSGSGRQEKENLFQQLVQQKTREEEANQLRWQVHLGSDPVTPDQRKRIRHERESAAAPYQVTGGSQDSGRVLRSLDEVPAFRPHFDLYVNEQWASRKRAMSRLQQAARKVLIRCRADRRLISLRNLLGSRHKPRPPSPPSYHLQPIEEESGRDFPLSAQRVAFHQFPPYPAEPGEPVPGDLRSAPPNTSAAQLRQRLPLYTLQAPQRSRLMGYHRLLLHGASPTFQPRDLARPLRSGAQEELRPDPAPSSDVPGTAVTQPIPEKEGGALTLTPPHWLCSPPHLQPLHVFNPAPGLMSFKKPHSYSETDIERHLCPLPTYPNQSHPAGATQRRLPSREEIIRGIVTWRKFPAPSVSTTVRDPNSRRSRWCDVCDLLPVFPPVPLTDWSQEEKERPILRDADDSGVWLTLDMVRAEFTPCQQMEQQRAPVAPVVEEEEGGNTLAEKVRGRLGHMKLLLHKKMIII